MGKKLLLCLLLYPMVGWGAPSKITIPHGWFDSCPRPFKGSDDPIAKDLNSTWVSKVGAEGIAPSEKTKKEILVAAQKAAEAGQLTPDIQKKGVEALKGALASKKVKREGRVLSIESNGCGLGIRQWRELAVIWLSEPCKPAVMLFHQEKSAWKFACITEIVHSENGQ